MRTRSIFLAAAIVVGGLSTPVGAAEYEVKMLNQGEGGAFVFEPDLLRIQAGDTVHFKAIDRNHRVGNKRGILPDGAEPFLSRRNQDLSVTFDVTGVYGYECFVHIHTFGMIGAVVVGDDLSNLDAIKEAASKTSQKERERFEAIFTRLEGG